MISPSALIGNMLVVPLAFVVVATGCITLLVGTVSDLGAEIFNHANRVFITWLFDIVDYFRTAPGGHTYVRSPGWLIVSAYFIMLASIGFLRSQVGKVCFTIGLAGVLAGLGVTAQVRQHVQLHVLDVGHGQALHVALPGREHMLVDTGPEFYASRVTRHLRKQGVNSLYALVLTHGDVKHVGAAKKILNDFRIQELWVSPVVQRSGVYAHLISIAQEKEIPVRYWQRGDHVFLPGGAEWSVLHPQKESRSSRADDSSIVSRIGWGPVSVLMMGGGSGVVESQLLNADLPLESSLLILGGQGPRDGGSEQFLNAVAPAVCIISVGAYNRSGLPDRNVTDRVLQAGAQLWRTDEEGGVTFSWGQQSLSCGALFETRRLDP